MKIDLDAILAGCCKTVGVDPFELAPLDRDGLDVFAESALFSATRHRLDLAPALAWIVSQLKIEATLRKRLHADPTLAQVPVRAPVFIVAPGRTGSTLLQWLLWLEPSVRTPLLWELQDPMHGDDPASRRQSIRASKEALTRVSPIAMKLHPMAADAPDECHWLMRHNLVRAGFHHTKTYADWLTDLRPAGLAELYRGYRRQVQAMQAADPGRTWLSKSFAHMLYWPVLFDVFPDARVIRIHRDPRQTIASSCSLYQHLMSGGDPFMLGDGVLDSIAGGLDRMMAADAAVPPGQVLDIMFQDLTASPGGTARQIARWLELPDPEAFGGVVDRYLAGAKGIRAARHTPALEDFGVTADEVLARCEAYTGWVRARLDPAFAR